MRLQRLALSLAAALAIVSSAGAQDPVLPGGWTTRAEKVPVTYKIDVELVETGIGDGIRLVGDETIFWENTSQEPVKLLYLHTYANAFRNTRSTLLREAAREDRFEIPDDMRWGELKFTRVSTHDEELKAKWVAPDDGNADDRTVAKVELGSAVEPGAKLALRIGFTVDMPRVIRRMGTKNGFVMAAQWYPKLGMHVGRESKLRNVRDGWYCHQYHANCEFAADFADYDVTIKFPQAFKVGATGVASGEDAADAEGVVTRRYRAESVVDFAWAADKRFEVREYDVTPIQPENDDDPASVEWQRRRLQRGESAADAALPTVKVVLLLQPEHADQAERTREAVRVALGFFGTWLGPYPYSRLTVVDPPWNAAAAGGMEYPMLITAGTIAGSLRITQRPEHVTVHEAGHQWLMGTIASNEAEDAWLDEGVNTYLTALAMDLGSHDPAVGFSGPGYRTTDVLGLHVPYAPFFEFPGIAAGWPEAIGLPKWLRPGTVESLKLWRDVPPLSYVSAPHYGLDPMLPLRRSYMRRAGVDEMVKTGWTYADRTSYAVNAYSRPALFLSSLRRSLTASMGEEKGDAAFFRALRDYAREFRFRHPTTDDFMRRWKESGVDPGPLADQLVRTASTFDYSVDGVRGGGDPKLEGLDEKGLLVRPGMDPQDDAPKSSIVRVMRRGGAVLPVTLAVARKDGTTQRVVWETKDQAKERWRDIRFEGEVTAARIDPDGVFLQDTDLSNNGFTKEANARPAVKWSVRFLSWLENAMISYGRFF